MPKYWGKQIFSLGRFPEVGQKQKTEKKEGPKVGNNNGQLRIATPPQVAHTKLPGPKSVPWYSGSGLNQKGLVSGFLVLDGSELIIQHVPVPTF